MKVRSCEKQTRSQNNNNNNNNNTLMNWLDSQQRVWKLITQWNFQPVACRLLLHCKIECREDVPSRRFGDGSVSIMKSSFKNRNPMIENMYTRISARTAVKIIERPFRVTLWITFQRVSSRKTTSKSWNWENKKYHHINTRKWLW